jgi:hypothetical protein
MERTDEQIRERVSADAYEGERGVIARLSAWSRGCLTMQGYAAVGDPERRELWLGLRFSLLLCFTGIALGTALESPPILLVMAGAAFVGGFVTPKHPFDYLYDGVLRPLLGGPAVPVTPPPRRFACQLAAPWIVAVAVAFLAGSPTLAWILAGPLLVVSATATTTNWCLPSFIYGHLRRRRGGGLNPPAETT